MAETALTLASRVQKWDSDFFAEYVRDNRFRPYMGRDTMMPIVVKYELTSGGKQINIPIIARLNGNGVQDNARLAGNEEALGNFNHPITVRWNRNAVSLPKSEEHWTEMNLRSATRSVLKTWAAESLRDDVVTALLSFTGASYLASSAATYYAGVAEATKDTWLVNNADRVLFGAAKSNGSSNDHSTALATIDNTADKMTTGLASLAKELAKEADPHIRPFRVEEMPGREFFVMFTQSRAFRDLKADSVMQQANRDARPREVGSNPIFQDGDLIYDGIIFREIPDIPVISNGTIDVAPNFLVGAQAVGLAWGQEPKSTSKKEDDYGFFTGLGIEECRGASKIFRDETKQHGMVTVYTAGVASA
jgi:hypothetical protein